MKRNDLREIDKQELYYKVIELTKLANDLIDIQTELLGVANGNLGGVNRSNFCDKDDRDECRKDAKKIRDNLLFSMDYLYDLESDLDELHSRLTKEYESDLELDTLITESFSEAIKSVADRVAANKECHGKVWLSYDEYEYRVESEQGTFGQELGGDIDVPEDAFKKEPRREIHKKVEKMLCQTDYDKCKCKDE